LALSIVLRVVSYGDITFVRLLRLGDMELGWLGRDGERADVDNRGKMSNMSTVQG
jgi:hypothetical protein